MQNKESIQLTGDCQRHEITENESELGYVAYIEDFKSLSPVHYASVASLGHDGVKSWLLVGDKVIEYEKLCVTTQFRCNSLGKKLDILSWLFEQSLPTGDERSRRHGETFPKLCHLWCLWKGDRLSRETSPLEMET